jgi:hypothetical protein
MSDDTLTADSLLARIHADGLRRTLNALRKPPVPSRILQELITLTDDPEALHFVAAYPLSPSHLLESLADSEPSSSVLAYLATNPRTPPHLITQFSVHADATVRAQAAAHPQLPSREIHTLATDSSAVVRRALAANASLRLPHQAVLITDSDPAVRLRLACQTSLPEPVALVLGADSAAAVRLHTVATATVEDELLEGWAASDEEPVQLALLQRKNLPVEICHNLLRSSHACVRRLARAGLDLDDVDLLFLITRGEPDERSWVATQPLLPRPLQSLLARDPEPAVHVSLAANPALDPVIAHYFVTLGDASVCEALAGNSALPDDLMQALAATRQPTVLAALAYRENLDEALAGFLIQHSADFRQHWAIQGRTEVVIDVETARQLFADPRPTVRVLSLTACPDWRRADLYELARDPAASVRIAAARHGHAADGLLEDLSTDSDPDVVAIVRDIQALRAAAPAVEVAAAPTARKTTKKSRQTDVDVPRPRPTLASPNSSAGAANNSRPSAPEIFHKLKRIFWQ